MDVQFADLEDGLITDILSLDIEGKVVGGVDVLPNAEQVVIGDLDGVGTEALQRKVAFLLDLVLLEVEQVLIRQILEG